MGGLPAKTVNGFVMDPTNPKVMYAAMRDGLFKSTDAGQSWTAVGAGLRNLAAVTVNPRQAAEVAASSVEGVLYRSRDGGRTWERQK